MAPGLTFVIPIRMPPSRKSSGYESPDEEHPPPMGARCRPAIIPTPDLEAGNNGSFPFSNPSSLDGMVTKAKDMKPNRKVGIRDRVSCHQWTWFTMTMVSPAVHSIPR